MLEAAERNRQRLMNHGAGHLHFTKSPVAERVIGMHPIFRILIGIIALALAVVVIYMSVISYQTAQSQAQASGDAGAVVVVVVASAAIAVACFMPRWWRPALRVMCVAIAIMVVMIAADAVASLGDPKSRDEALHAMFLGGLVSAICVPFAATGHLPHWLERRLVPLESPIDAPQPAAVEAADAARRSSEQLAPAARRFGLQVTGASLLFLGAAALAAKMEWPISRETLARLIAYATTFVIGVVALAAGTCESSARLAAVATKWTLTGVLLAIVGVSLFATVALLLGYLE